MKILVTGITGFIGRNLIPFLAPEDEVWCLVRGRKIMTHNYSVNLRYINGDLREPRELFRQLEVIKPEICVHLAWQDIPDFSFGTSIENLYQGTRLFQFLVEKCGCKKIISMGSCFEYGRNFARCHEEDPLVLNSYFAWAKSSLCNFGMMLAKKHQINFFWARPFYIYGEGQRSGSLIPNVYHKLKSGEPLIIKTPHNRIDLIHVKDVAKALIIMIEQRNGTSEIFNLGSGDSIPVWRVVEYVEREMEREPEASIFLRSCEPFDAQEDLRANIELAKHLLGWLPIISIEEGIRDYIKNTA